MNKTFSIAIIFAAVSTFSANADSAFGIEYGAELPPGAEDAGRGYFFVKSPSKPHSLLDVYAVKYTAETGVCEIMASSEDFIWDKRGKKAKPVCDKLAEALDRKYGPKGNTREELKRVSSLYGNNFAMTLRQGDREHKRWFLPSADNKNEFDYVEIMIHSANGSDTYIILHYKNRSLSEDCNTRLSEADTDSL